jgi:hypothetical protein
MTTQPINPVSKKSSDFLNSLQQGEEISYNLRNNQYIQTQLYNGLCDLSKFFLNGSPYSFFNNLLFKERDQYIDHFYGSVFLEKVSFRLFHYKPEQQDQNLSLSDALFSGLGQNKPKQHLNLLSSPLKNNPDDFVIGVNTILFFVGNNNSNNWETLYKASSSDGNIKTKTIIDKIVNKSNNSNKKEKIVVTFINNYYESGSDSRQYNESRINIIKMK